MPSLLELQQAVRRSVLEGDDTAISPHVLEVGIAACDRLSIYRRTFGQTLTRALRLSYPAIERLVGTDFFSATAGQFIVRQPPPSSCLDDFGGSFAGFLQQFEPAASLPYLGDVARLEWAVSQALHGPDAAPLALAALSAVDACDHSAISFVAHPSASLLQTDFPADRIWRAVLDDDDAALAALDLAQGPAWLMVRRGVDGVEVVRHDEATWRFIKAVCAGVPLGQAAAEHPGGDVATVLAELLVQGCLVGFNLGCQGEVFEEQEG